jgi:hypothetical protein
MKSIQENSGLASQGKIFRTMGIVAILVAMFAVFTNIEVYDNSTIVQFITNPDILIIMILFVIADFCAHKAVTAQYNYLEKENEVLNSQLVQLEVELQGMLQK